MTNDRPIGIFDSGLGGLTVAKEIFQALPNESTIYIGDTARVPYGNRSPETITQFSSQMVSFLISQRVKAVVVACATASSFALESLRIQFPGVPIYGVINAAAKTASESTHNHQIGIIGTRGTIASGAFARAVQANDPDATIYAQACPLFVPIIEEGMTKGKIVDAVIEKYMMNLPPSIDTLVMGCTHYPIIAEAIGQFLPKTTLINPGKSLAGALTKDLKNQQLLSDKTKAVHTFFATDVTNNFKETAQMFLGFPIELHHHHLDG